MGARMFAGVVPPDAIVDELDAFLAPRRDAEPRLRWTHPHSWHLTTVFMANVPDRNHDRLIDNLAGAASRTVPFAVHLAGGGAFPHPRQTKVLWLGLDAGAAELTALARRTRNAAEHAGVPTDGARFVPHLTLGRAHRSLDSTRLLNVLDAFDAPGWVANELVLIESHLHDRGNRYEVIERFAFGVTPQRETLG